jgi:hypothetical protein
LLAITAPPYPHGQQLATVAATLEREMPKYALAHPGKDRRGKPYFGGFSEMGVFWDWLSIPQKDPTLFDELETPDAKHGAERNAFLDDLKARRRFYGGEAYEKSRTEAETEIFRFALHKTMDLWYAHQGTTVYKLTRLPKGSTRKSGYHQSGWTTYESCSSEQIKQSNLGFIAWNLVLDLGHPVGQEAKRGWPVGPDDFDVLISTRQFTNGADQQAVKDLYRKMSVAQLGGITELSFTGMNAPSVDEARSLGRCLNLCERLERLSLWDVGMSDVSFRALLSALNETALPELYDLTLGGNQIGNAGMGALAAFLRRGGLPKVALDIHDMNRGQFPAGVRAQRAVEAALEAREADHGSGTAATLFGHARALLASLQASIPRLSFPTLRRARGKDVGRVDDSYGLQQQQVATLDALWRGDLLSEERHAELKERVAQGGLSGDDRTEISGLWRQLPGMVKLAIMRGSGVGLGDSSSTRVAV